MPPQLPTPARRLLEIAKLRDRLCRPIRRRFLLRRGVATLKSASCDHFLASFDLRRSFNFAVSFLQRRVGAAVGGGGVLAIVDASKPISLRAIVSFILLFLQINKSLSTVLFKSNQPNSWSRSVRYSSKVLVNPLFAGVNRHSRSRSAKRTSAELVNHSSVAIIVVPGAYPWKARVQNSLVFDPWHRINSWSRSVKFLSKVLISFFADFNRSRSVKFLSAMLVNPLFVGSRSRSAESTMSAELIVNVSELNDNDVVSFNSVLESAAESKLAENIVFGEEVSKRESAAGHAHKLLTTDFDLECSENLSIYDEVFDDYSSAYRELQSDILQESFDLDFSEYSPWMLYDSGSQFSEKSISDDCPSRSFHLSRMFSEEFCGSTYALREMTTSSYSDKLESSLTAMLKFVGLVAEVVKSLIDVSFGFGTDLKCTEGEVCHIYFTQSVKCTESAEIASIHLLGYTELPTCSVCLERLDLDTSGIQSTLCDHSFHCSCVSKWTYSSCQVCRLCQQQDERPTCSVCGTPKNLWVCLICGFVGCGRYEEKHAIRHWSDTQHHYSLELETQQIWDYVGDKYVHRLNQSKTDGKPATMNSSCAASDGECGMFGYDEDPGLSGVLYNSKVEAVVDEYNILLASQLETQRQHYESLLAEERSGKESTISKAVEKALFSKTHELQSRIEKCEEEKKVVTERNKVLMEKQEKLQKNYKEIEKRETLLLKSKNEHIQDLEEQIRDIKVYIEAQKKLANMGVSDGKDGTVLSVESNQSSSGGSKRRTKQGRRR